MPLGRWKKIAAWAVLAGLGLGAPSSSAAPLEEPARDWLSSAPVRSALDRMLEQAQYGLAPQESAAWIVRGTEGEVSLRVWPFTGAVDRAAWSGPPPDGALAIVHTHPRRLDPRPSSGDVALARRLGILVYTLTRNGIWAAHADGSVRLEFAAPPVCSRLVCLPLCGPSPGSC